MSGRQDPVDTFGRGKSKGKWGEDGETWRSKERERLKTKFWKTSLDVFCFWDKGLLLLIPVKQEQGRDRNQIFLFSLARISITSTGPKLENVTALWPVSLQRSSSFLNASHTVHGTERGTDYKRLVLCPVPFPQNLRFLLCQRRSRHESTRVPWLRSFLHQPPQIT